MKIMLNRVRIPSNIQYSLRVIGLLLILNFILRMAFLIYNLEQAKALPWTDMLISFLVGIRFDLATILLLNGVFFIFLVLPLPFNQNKNTFRIINVLIILVNVPMLILNAVDVIYFGFSEKRLTHELFTTKSDLLNIKIPDIIRDFWFMFVIIGIVLFALLKILKYFTKQTIRNHESEINFHGWKSWMIAGIWSLLLFAGMRGGVQYKFISPSMAFVTSNLFAGNMSMNSAFTVLRAIDFKEQPLNWMDKKEALEITRRLIKNDFDSEFLSDQYPLVRQSSFPGEEKKYNVVVIIVESLNANFVGSFGGENLTPTLDSLAKEGAVYTNFHATAVRSVEAMPSILNSFPDIFMRPTIGSRYEKNQTWGMANILRSKGYETAFFHGAHNGSLGFDRFAVGAGFQKYFGMDEYPNAEKDYDGLWGLYDDPFFQFMAEKQNAFQQPFLSVFFTSTNHHPFPLPEKECEDIAAMDITDQRKTVIYTDRAIRNYFTSIRNAPWADSTVFIITGDHCFHEASDPNRTFLGNFHIPLIVIAPGLKPVRDDRPASQPAVLPTLIEILKLNTFHSSTSVSLLNKEKKSFMLHQLVGVFSYAEEDRAYITTIKHPIPPLFRLNEKWIPPPLGEISVSKHMQNMDKLLKASFQTFQNCRVNNTIAGPPFLQVPESGMNPTSSQSP